MAGHIPDAKSIHYGTPNKYLAPVRALFDGRIALDPCGNEWSLSTVLAEQTYQIALRQSGLSLPWRDGTYFNPPFGVTYLHRETFETISRREYKELVDREVVRPEQFDCTTVLSWVERAANEWTLRGTRSVALLPAYVDTEAWQDVIYPTASAWCALRGRVKFEQPWLSAHEPHDSATMPCGMPYWGDDPLKFKVLFEGLGHVEILR